MTPTPYDAAYDLLAETCRRRWAQQFQPGLPDCVLCGPRSDETGGKANTPPTDETKRPSRLRWHYGPTAADPEPGNMWCYDCGAWVGGDDDGYWCSWCGRTDPPPRATWPPPRPGTHESDLTHVDRLAGYPISGQTVAASLGELLDGQHWSRANKETA